MILQTHANLKLTAVQKRSHDYLKELIMILKADIQFLRNEVQSKDKIIELLINDRESKNKHKNINLDTKSTVSNSVNVKHAEKIFSCATVEIIKLYLQKVLKTIPLYCTWNERFKIWKRT